MEAQQPGLLSQATRSRLFAAVGDLGPDVTTAELARSLGLHVNGVRRHLELMAEGGLLTRRRLKHGRGRPRDGWSIAPGAFGEARDGDADIARWLARAVPASAASRRRAEEVGREAGRALGVHEGALPAGLERAFTDLGFAPLVSVAGSGTVVCELANCPYRKPAKENPDVVCRLHRGLTEGLLERLAPGSRLTRFEPHDADEAGCTLEVVPAAGRSAARVASSGSGRR